MGARQKAEEGLVTTKTGWGRSEEARQGSTDSPTHHSRDQSLPPCIFLFQEKVTRTFGFNYSFSSPHPCQGGKGKQTAAWEGPPSRVPLLLPAAAGPGQGAGGWSSPDSSAPAFSDFSPACPVFSLLMEGEGLQPAGAGSRGAAQRAAPSLASCVTDRNHFPCSDPF